MAHDLNLNHPWFSIHSVEFGFYEPSEIRKASVKELTNPIAFDNNKLPQVNGLYDPALGVSPNDRSAVCITCGHAGLECSGHMGHIELLVPTYNPLVIDKLLQLVKSMCLECHRFRIRTHVTKKYVDMFKLIKKGMLNEASELHQLQTEHLERQLARMIRSETDMKEPKDKEGKEAAKAQRETEQDQQKKLRDRISKMKERRKQILQRAQQTKEVPMTNASISLLVETAKAYYKEVVHKCPHCSKVYRVVKKEGASKFFRMNEHNESRKASASTSKGDIQVEESLEVVSEKSVTMDRNRSIHSMLSGQTGQSRDKESQRESNKESNKDSAKDKSAHKKQSYLNPKEIYDSLKQLWRSESAVLEQIYGNSYASNSFNMFFLLVVGVPPNRFRPESKVGDEKYLHDHTTILTNVIKANRQLKHIIITESIQEGLGEEGKKSRYEERSRLSFVEIKMCSWFKETLKKLAHKHDFVNKWLELQDHVNCFLDASKASKMADRQSKGIKQILEKKEGLFRMKMMGKRVNYAARSVISPDPSLQTDQVGLPLFMAKKLTFPEPVNQYNSQRLKQYIINGKQYPGAAYIEIDKRLIRLDLLSDEKRLSLASDLLVNGHTKIVYRHLMTGDNVLFNRQPTLHKPGLMAHRIRVLPREQTLRMNYANCKSYNADFDGDEMNLHALQTYTAKAQAELCITDRIYANPTNGKPIRELIQDSIISAVYLTMKDTFLTKEEYSELLYQSTFALFANQPRNVRIFLLKPALLRPKRLWTGKQLISNIMKLIVSLSNESFKKEMGLTMKAKTKVPVSYLGQAAKEESEVLVFHNELLKGLIDKNQIGSNSDYGLVHSFNELYGYKLTGQLMTCLTKLFSSYLQVHGFTCGMDDLILHPSAEKSRKVKIEQAHHKTVQEVAKHLGVKESFEGINFVGRKTYECDENGDLMKEEESQPPVLTEESELTTALRIKYTTEALSVNELDEQFKHHLYEGAEPIIDESLKGFIKRFPHNNFSMMTVTGAKGSNINHSQVSVMLGQQELEGKRVPMMISKKTLPCFIPCDPNPRAYGFIGDRFLSGLREQEFFFHCMAGREGLIDTAVKTSRSGYLQRCLMKHLESLKVQYDYTVRDADSGIIQFYYGQDSIDPTRQKFLEKFDFLRENESTFGKKYDLENIKDSLKTEQIKEFKKKQPKDSGETIMNRFHIGSNLGSVSEKCYDDLKKYLKGSKQVKDKNQFTQLFQLKYLHSLVQPGESVGCTAAQAVGEPSTQMTLNTFHLAGHGGVNLTLGIPRLREILMTSTDKLKTPVMELYFRKQDSITTEEANFFAQQLQKVRLLSLVHQIEVEQRKKLFEKDQLLSPQYRKRIYKIRIIFESIKLIEREFGINYDQIQEKIRGDFILSLLDFIDRVQKKSELKTEHKRTHKQENDEDAEEDKMDEEQQEEGDQQPPKPSEIEIEEDKEDKEERDRYKRALDSPFYESMNFSKDDCTIEVKVPLSLKKFLMTNVVERLLKATILRQTKGINRAVVVMKNGRPYIQTQGVNFKAVGNLQFIDQSNTSSNDIQAIYHTFGVEAARAAIIKEIVSVFRPYGVEVNHRHLYLIADYLTFPGVIKAMNRNWMQDHVSPFLKMSFETSVNFLTMAACYHEVDTCRTPSSQIVLGQPPTVGTGVFDLLMDMKFKGE